MDTQLPLISTMSSLIYLEKIELRLFGEVDS